MLLRLIDMWGISSLPEELLAPEERCCSCSQYTADPCIWLFSFSNRPTARRIHIMYVHPSLFWLCFPFFMLRWSRGSVLAFSTQVCGFKPGRSRRIFRAKKIISTPSFGAEVKLLVLCCRFVACKRSLNLRGSRNLGKIITGHLSCPQFHLSLLGSLASLRTEAPGD